MSVEIGTQLGRYKVISRLGVGGMAEVYLAQDTQLKRSVALKLLSDKFAFDEIHLHRFALEARAASSLNHPNILTIYEVGESEHIHFIATELVEGSTLRRRLKKVRLNLSEALDISIQVAAALTAAHAVGIVHRDIKPENIMVRPDGFVKVLDFGLAKLTEKPVDTSSSDSQVPTVLRFDTEPGAVLGTTRYMSPEQVRGLKLDNRTDIWSLGVTLYEMLTGRQPFDAPSIGDVIAAILEHEPVPLDRHVRGAPPDLQLILNKSLTKDLSQRYRRAEDLMNDLRRIRRRQELELELSQPTLTQVSGGLAGSSSGGTPTSGRQVTIGSPGFAGSASSLRKRRTTKKVDSIAIMPLTNAGGDPETEYLADGITEAIINTLSKLPKLKVMARSTVFRYKGKEVDPQQVGFDLGIRSVLMGRLLQRGDELIINTELIDVADGSQIWGEQYNRKHTELLAVQDEIATEISDKLRLKLTQTQKQQLTRRATENIEAYHLYLKGRYYWNKRTGPALIKGRDYFMQAIDVDPNYALAYAGLADSYTVLASWNILPSSEAFPKSRVAATKALEIDKTLAEAHASLGFVNAVYDWDWAKAEKEFKSAMKANPDYATAHEWYALFLSWSDRHDEAIVAARLAQNLDPLTPIITTVVGVVLHYARRYQEAVAEYEKVLELDPLFLPALCFRGAAYSHLGLFEKAIADEQAALKVGGPTSVAFDLLGYAQALSGDRQGAEETLGRLRELAKERYVSPFSMAHTYVGLGQYDRAIECLEQACEERYHRAATIKVDSSFDPLHSDPRFQRLLERMGLVNEVKSKKEKVKRGRQ
jgi:eukaryotic-like serine/threonine-protein kinase